MKSLIEKIKNNKKNLIINLILIIFCSILLFLLLLNKKDNNVAIDIGKNNVGYIYGPNNETIVKMHINDTGTLKILAQKSKLRLVKCYSSNENVVSIDKQNFKAVGNGDAQIYCELKKNKSNEINVKVGD